MAVEGGAKAHMTGGEPLWHVSQKPNVFFQGEERPNAVANERLRELPSAMFRPPHRFSWHGYDGHRTAARRNIHGSRLFTTRFGSSSLSTEHIGSLRHMPKRLPSKRTPELLNSLNS
jgi:hypothetical protein